MPNRKGTGPTGVGPLTGRGAGKCATKENDAAGEAGSMGRAMRRGNRCGGGRGMGRKGAGRRGGAGR